MMRSVRLSELSAAERAGILRRSAVPDDRVRAAATEITTAIRDGGDAALADAGAKYGGGRPEPRVSAAEMEAAWRDLDPELASAIDAAIDAVTTYHRHQHPQDLSVETHPGVTIGRRWSPIGSVGAYVPGGKAAYPSSLIMTIAPAIVAGVQRLVVATPAGPAGEISGPLLGAAHRLGVQEVYAMGGAQAIAALAYGTETLRRVDKIVGPGNAWVTAAKLAVYGACSIDLPAGPSEVVVIADHTAEPRLVAADLLCQAEHGPDSPAILVTTEDDIGTQTLAEIDRLLDELSRAELLAEALENHGLIVVVDDVATAIDFANDYAGEHVTVMTDAPEDVAKAITGAGSIYVGRWAPESAGDYATGANHVLPTGGLARACGPLSVEDYGSWRQVQEITEDGLRTIEPTICALAEAEGLTAHSLAARIRFETSSRGAGAPESMPAEASEQGAAE
jgi:histidinol dehydrogenase